MSRPDVEQVLAALKGFQRNTVEHAFHRLFLAPDSTARFLVADEVGLGKTLVARGIIAKAIDHLWDDVERIDVLYICSNASIARQNLAKLRIPGAGERSFALATRLTLLATQLAPRDGQASLADSKLNFVSFTPQTSFHMGHSTGVSDERVVLFHLLEHLIGRWTGLANLLQGGIQSSDKWRQRLRCWTGGLDEGIRQRFAVRWDEDDELRRDVLDLVEGPFARVRAHWPSDLRWERNKVVGRLRRRLAELCVDALEPDLIVMDEFQRFKGLLETRAERQDPAAALAQQLFDARPEGEPVRTLLLSATPYKLYTADAEIEQEDHYKDFIDTTRFLLSNDEDRVVSLQRDIARFGAALKRAAAGQVDGVDGARRAVEGRLRAVMARTERVGDTAEQDAMVQEPHVATQVHREDVRQYLAADALFRAVEARDPMPFWKSAPYLPHFMRGYRFNRRMDDVMEGAAAPVAKVLRSFPDAFLSRETVGAFERLPAGHAKLRALVAELLDEGQWKLLWMPPTAPYWPLEGAYAGQEGQTKALVFSAWNVVPDVLTAMLSYETERRMFGENLPTYTDVKHSPLLRLARGEDGRRASHRNLLTLLPCLPLADAAHPLGAPEGTDRRLWVRQRVQELLAELPDPAGERRDERWEVVLPLLLDPGLGDFLQAWRASDRTPPNLGDYVDDLLSLADAELGPRPEGLEELAVELALGSPGVVAARTLGGFGVPDALRRRVGAEVGLAFWSLFNRPSVIQLMRQLHADVPHWRAVIRYARDGNLQAVLDEAWHLLWEQHAWTDDLDAEEVTLACADVLCGTASPQRASVQATLYHPTPEGGADRSSVSIRMSLAQRFGDAQGDDGRRLTQDAVRAAFNSPFRPFVLASTSVGQEGLDFHPWCHRLVHWNLPGNPVDMEQREGRVHRFKGHAVRRNVAAVHADEALALWAPGEDLWAQVFALADDAARGRGESELVPFWIAEGPFKVIRHVPLLPFTREVEAFARLKRQLAAYRVVFGQPRQEELLRLLDRAEVDVATLRQWVVDLRPTSGR